jgi:ATP-dependent Clp protease ATP-binding subunit ClpA
VSLRRRGRCVVVGAGHAPPEIALDSLEVFERFTEPAREVVVFAQDEARRLQHNYIGTEHLLLGLLREEEGLAARVLESLEITADQVRAEVARVIGRGEEPATGQMPFTPRAKKVLELALREAQSLHHGHIGTEHILLGLVREKEGVAARILLDLHADPETVRNAVTKTIGEPLPPHPAMPEIEGLQRQAAVYGGLVGWLIFAGALGIGLLLGWLIWG